MEWCAFSGEEQSTAFNPPLQTLTSSKNILAGAPRNNVSSGHSHSDGHIINAHPRWMALLVNCAF